MENIVIVGVDGSDTAQKAAEAAAELAAALGARLHVVTAYDDPEYEVIEVGSDQFVVSGADTAHQTAQSAANALGVRPEEVTVAAVEGSPADVLLAQAKRLDARMIVMGNRRMQGVSRVLGSVAAKVSHHAPCDVYIVKTV